jgi:hypothetical protein
MAEDRPEKQRMRALWADEFERVKISRTEDVSRPLLLAMPGFQAGDIQALIERGLVERAENNAIAESDAMRIAAIESNLSAIAALKDRFPGMRIIPGTVADALRSEAGSTYPVGTDKQLLRADMVNLDLNQPLVARFVGLQLEFPVLRHVQKLAQLHADDPRVEWTLCLTLHGEVHWDAPAREAVCRFLAENCAREPAFAEAMRALLGDEASEAILDGRPDDLPLDDVVMQQLLLMVCVPKRILSDVHAQGWALHCRHNIRYGGTAQRAPMVSWVIDFVEDPRGSTEPDALYRECLRSVLDNTSRIDGDGELQPLFTS